MKLYIAQLNPTVGDIEGNLLKIKKALKEARSEKAELVIFSELFMVGYPTKDLLERRWFIEKTHSALKELKKESLLFPELGLLFGMPMKTGKKTGTGLYNSAVLVSNGEILGVQHKTLLPNYDVFDETRYFETAATIKPIKFKNQLLGISICEDAWSGPEITAEDFPSYERDPIKILSDEGATVIINISASPFQTGKDMTRYNMAKYHSTKNKLPFVYVNQVGGNDELIFDGSSFVMNAQGDRVISLNSFKEEGRAFDLDNLTIATPNFRPIDEIEAIHDALILGVGDYLKKSGFNKAVIGLSGGIDSALTCYIAKKALGSEKVLGISMPSPYSSQGSVEDSRKLAENLGIEFKVIQISSIFKEYLDTLNQHFAGKEPDETEENIQARIRGDILMSFSNKFGYLLLSTGNKSEMAVGYCTLYGDMSGGLSVLSDVPKILVYKIARYINRDTEIIPEDTITKPPSAELRPDQKDQDTLPSYDVLDGILYYYIEENMSVDEIAKKGYDKEIVAWVVNRVDKNEYKRKQAPLGLKVTSKAFGFGRRMPIAAKF